MVAQVNAALRASNQEQAVYTVPKLNTYIQNLRYKAPPPVCEGEVDKVKEEQGEEEEEEDDEEEDDSSSCCL
jgi:hypothetical protein